MTGNTQAVTITLDFDSLPSEQGWSYGGTSESSAYSVSGGVLRMNSNYGYYESYNIPGVVNRTGAFSLNTRARVIEGSGIWLSFYVSAGSPYLAVFGLSSDAIYYHDGNGYTVLKSGLDNTQFHDFRMEGLPDINARVYYDGVDLGAIPFIQYPDDGISFGDDGGSGSGTAEISYYSFSQDPESAPEPGTSFLFFVGLISLLILKKTPGRDLISQRHEKATPHRAIGVRAIGVSVDLNLVAEPL